MGVIRNYICIYLQGYTISLYLAAGVRDNIRTFGRHDGAKGLKEAAGPLLLCWWCGLKFNLTYPMLIYT